jgi:hypothetical protein
MSVDLNLGFKDPEKNVIGIWGLEFETCLPVDA